MIEGRNFAWVIVACLATGFPVVAQEAEVAADGDVEQILVDLDALILGTSATLRCALYNSDLAYLSPLEAAGAEIRIRQIEASLAPVVENLADRAAEMRAEASAVPCGNAGLLPFLEFSRQAGRDVVDIGVSAWATIRFEVCSYFADDDFISAVERARIAAAELTVSGDAERVAYIAENASRWTTVFAENCYNLAFDPTQTLPGQIALALPAS